MKILIQTALSSVDSPAKQLLNYFNTLDKKQQNILVYTLPAYLEAWFFGASMFEGRIKNDNPHLSVSATGGKEHFHALIVTMAAVRRIYPPKTSNKIIYRATELRTKTLPEVGSIYKFSNKNQLKSLTSWTRSSSITLKAKRYIRLSYRLQGSKNVLFDWLSVQSFLRGIKEILPKLRYSTTGQKNITNRVNRALKSILKGEQEVAVYLNSSDVLECTVDEVFTQP